MSIKILLVDDSELMRAGIRAKLETIEDFEIIGEAVDGVDAIAKVGEMQPDVVVMDINMPNLSGIEATAEILVVDPDIKIIGLSIHSGEHYVKGMLKAGAKAYLLKDDVPDELIRAINKVVNGEMYLSSTITEVALKEDEKKDHTEDIIILQTKLHRPTIMDSYVLRKKIVDKLENNIKMPLSVITAGAGYGKSVAVRQWIEHSSYNHTWLSMDEEHNDFRTFLVYLCAAIEKIAPGTLEATKDLIKEENLPPFRLIFNTLINEICEINKHFILVLDDFQEINEKNIHHLFDTWLRFPPPNIHLAIISRLDPLLKINSLRNNNQMIEIRMNDLSFSDDEVADLFKKLLEIDLDHQTIELLQDETKGWIVGLRMASMLIEDKENLDNILDTLKTGFISTSNHLISIESAKHVYKIGQKHSHEPFTLTPGELTVLQCLADGLSNKEIAAKLFKSIHTIKKHITNMFDKMDIHKRQGLVSKGIELGFLEKKN